MYMSINHLCHRNPMCHWGPNVNELFSPTVMSVLVSSHRSITQIIFSMIKSFLSFRSISRVYYSTLFFFLRCIFSHHWSKCSILSCPLLKWNILTWNLLCLVSVSFHCFSTIWLTFNCKNKWYKLFYKNINRNKICQVLFQRKILKTGMLLNYQIW